MDMITLAAARKYVADTANALGAVKGSPCTITSITEADDGIHIVFSWTGTDGTVATQTAIMPYVAVDRVAREAVETLREDMGEAIDTTVRSINGRKPDSVGNVALPLSVTGVPNTGSPHQVFVTDGDGNPMWDDRQHWLELAVIYPEVLTDPDVAILYDAGKTEIAANEYANNTDIQVAYFPNVEIVQKYGMSQSNSDSVHLKAVILPNVKRFEVYSMRRNGGLVFLHAPKCEYIAGMAFEGCSELKEAYFPGVVSMDENVGPMFSGCSNLTDLSFPNCTNINADYAFEACVALANINFPKLETASKGTFRGDTSLKKAEFPVLKNIGVQMFNQCSALETLILRSSTMCTLANISAFNKTPIASGTGYIYVPSALIEDYRVATNWSTYAAQFRAIEDWPEICGEDVDEYITKGEAAKLVGEKVAQPDWNQNDPEAADYVKNRTHYTETTVTETAGIAETEVTGSVTLLNVYAQWLVVGAAVRVYFDGTPYECPVTGANPFYLGDANHSAYPFYIMHSVTEAYVTISVIDDGASHTVSVYKLDTAETVKKIDEKYIPDSIQRAEDNVVIPSGKSLTLQAGATVNDEAGVLGGSVQTVNGIAPDDAGNVEIEIPEGFSGSWNDLTDKPFEQIATTATMLLFQDLTQTDYTHNGYTLYFRDDRPLTEYGSWTSQGYNVSLTEGDDISLYSSNAGTSFEGTVMKAEVPSTGLEFLYFGNLGLVNEIMAETFDGHNFDDTGERHLVIMFDGPTWVVASTYKMAAQLNRWSFPVRKIVTLEEKYIPSSIARTTDIPTVPIAAAVADAAGDTPTAAEFNALLSALRTAGLLAT